MCDFAINEKHLTSYIVYSEHMNDHELYGVDLSEHEDSFQYVNNLGFKDPVLCLEYLKEIITKCNNNRMLASVAAGPLEDLLVDCTREEVLKKLENIADGSEQFQLALSGVWIDEEDNYVSSVFVNRLLKKYNFVGTNPKEVL